MPYNVFIAVVISFTLAAAAPAAEPSQAQIIQGNLLAPQAFRAATRRVAPSLVKIETFGGFAGGAARVVGEGPTTGLVISADGYVLTSTFNFIKNPPVITVLTSDGHRHVAKLAGRDDERKICLLKIDAENLPVPKLVQRDKLRIGQWAITVGAGFGGKQPAISAGIISATNRIGGRAVQTDANISPANYGGPLLDIEGRVIGICVPLAPQSKEAASGVQWYDSGIGFAIPLDNVEKLLNDLQGDKSPE